MLNRLLVFCNIHTKDLNGCTSSSTTEVECELEYAVETSTVCQTDYIDTSRNLMTSVREECIVISLQLRLNRYTVAFHVSRRFDGNREIVGLAGTEFRAIMLDMDLSLPLVTACSFRNREAQAAVDITIDARIKAT